MLLTSLQSQKVEEIVRFFNDGNKRVDFKAITGSGKTLMASGVIARLINTNPDKKMLFIIATVSNADLPEQFERKLNEYKGDLEYNDFEVEYIRSPSSDKSDKTPKDMQVQITPEQNKVYLFGKSSFGKNRIITEQKIIDTFVQEAKQQNYTICYIRDEAHIGASKISKADKANIANFEQLMQENADFILRMTATLDMSDNSTQKVRLTERELTNPDKNDGKWLIKTTSETLYDNEIDDDKILNHAIQQFKKIQKQYASLDCIIKPAMLIQVDNEPSDANEKQDFYAAMDMIKQQLSKEGLSWVKYFGNTDKEASNVDNDNFTLDKITRNDDTTDCIIFKIGPATGWDIPRACMLLRLRRVCSKNLDIQTVGRIKRNPYPGLIKKEITDKYYLYSNSKSEQNEDFSVCKYKVKEQFMHEEFASIEIKKDKQLFDKSIAKREIINYLNNSYNKIKVRINDSFRDNKYRNEQSKILITSPILLLKALKIKEAGLSYNQKQVFLVIEQELKNTDLKDVKLETLKIILLDNFMSDINNVAQRCIESNIKYELVMHSVKPTDYTEVICNDDSETITDNYLFNMWKNGNEDKEQYLDSSNEPVIFNEIKSYIRYGKKDSIRVWAKNQTTGNIYGEYLDENKSCRKSFFDFVIKYSNGVFLYIEVKGEQDINPLKTEALRRAYADYFKKEMQQDLFHQKMIICVAKVKNREITPEIFYDRTLLNLSDALPFDELLKEIGEC
jgi:type III restriction enzyme